MTDLYVTYDENSLYVTGVWTTPQPNSELFLMEGAVLEHDGRRRVYLAYDGARITRIFQDAQSMKRYTERTGNDDTGRVIVDR